MSDYKNMVRNAAKEFGKSELANFADDAEEFGGKSEAPNLGKWLDRTRKLFEHIDGVSKSWTRADATMVQQSSRNSVTYGDPKQAAYFAFYEDVLHEVKKLHKAKSR